MSERFLEGYIIEPRRFDKLIGTAKLAAKTVRRKLRGSAIVRDMEMTFGQGWDDESAAEGAAILDAALDALAAGRPTRHHEAYELTRASALVLAAYGTRLGTIELVPYVAGDSFGLMNPALAALGMKTMAKEYGRSSFAFPYVRRTKTTRVDWPIMMLVGASLAAWKRELATDWRTRVRALPDKPFTSRRYRTEPEEIAETKRDLVKTLAKLQRWVERAAAKRGSALVLVLDGDQ